MTEGVASAKAANYSRHPSCTLSSRSKINAAPQGRDGRTGNAADETSDGAAPGVAPSRHLTRGNKQKELQVKVKELNALLGKLAKSNPDKEVTLSYPGIFDDNWDEPTLVETSQRAYIVPKSLEDQIEANHTPEQVKKNIQQAFDNYRQAQAGGQRA